MTTDFFRIEEVDDVRILGLKPLIPPQILFEELPTNNDIRKHLIASRKSCTNIIHQKDDRLLVVVGPCSIHDTEAAVSREMG